MYIIYRHSPLLIVFAIQQTGFRERRTVMHVVLFQNEQRSGGSTEKKEEKDI